MKLISVEGIDGSGKTTLTAALGAALAEQRDKGDVALHHEPSHDEVGLLFRTLSSDLGYRSYGINERISLALLSAADRHRQQGRFGALEENGTELIVSDRYYLSGLAYHTADGIDPAFYQSLNRFIRRPDLYLYLDIDPAMAARRKDAPADRWETESIAAAVPAAYENALRLIRDTECAAVTRIDASRLLPEVLKDALASVDRLFRSGQSPDC
jgi:dTMP kinase